MADASRRFSGRENVAFVRRALMLIVALSVVGATRWLYGVFLVDGISPLETLILVLFAILFAWISASFWMTCLGAFLEWRGIVPDVLDQPSPEAAAHGALGRPRTALVMAVYNEDVLRIFAGIEGIYESLR
jgi:membrane glycosyltransferase